MENPKASITVSDVLEYLFCPRFIYFMYCLLIPQHEEKRFKVNKGRQVHERKEKLDKSYLRKKLGVVRKEVSVYLSSEKYPVRGIVDEVLFLEDGTAAPLDYKFAEYKNKVFKTYRYQLALYALLIQEIYDITVKKGFICYVRSNNYVKEVSLSERDFENAIKVVDEILEIIQNCNHPKKPKGLSKCIDCCYRNICV